MISTTTVVVTAFAYLFLLFLLAFVGDNLARKSKGKFSEKFLSSPIIYTLSISVYCTSWTFYGAVGSAARSGLEFLAIYLGPTLVFVGWWFILRKIVRIAKTHRITSIADFISSRYGKSNTLAVVVTLMAVLGTTPYISLQLKAVSVSFKTITANPNPIGLEVLPTISMFSDTAFWVAASMALFTILFGTRNVGADEHHHGVVAAIAFESLVKLIALVSVGIFVLYFVGDGIADLAQKVAQSAELKKVVSLEQTSAARWITLLFLSATAIICLPRQFQVTVVEAAKESHLEKASWMFPSYLLLICLFVIPIALTGLITQSSSANPDMFVLTVPLNSGNSGLSMLAFIGGFSSATSMVIVASIALSIMVSNHIVMPTLLHIRKFNLQNRGDLTSLLLNVRRICIIVILALGYLYYRISVQTDALASIGLISFVGIAQLLPVLIAGLFWRGGTRNGAIAALLSGFFVWFYTLILPSLARSGWLFTSVVEHGPLGLTSLKPEILFGVDIGDPLVHALIWSYIANISAFLIVSFLGTFRPIDRLQMTLFVDAFRHSTNKEQNVWERSAKVDDLVALSERMLGKKRSENLFKEHARSQGIQEVTPTVDPQLISKVELALAGTIGAASARVLVSGVVQGDAIELDEVIKILDETQQVVEYSQKLEEKSKELQVTAAELQQANFQLKRMDKLKDDFLSRVSHELRTPMTSIRSMSEILKEELIQSVSQQQESSTHQTDVNRFLDIIVSECERLTRLLNEILDLSTLENEEQSHPYSTKHIRPALILVSTIESMQGLATQLGVKLDCQALHTKSLISADEDRLKQVLINLVSNALKFNDHQKPWVKVKGYKKNNSYMIEVADNGPGIAADDHEVIFSKFGRGTVGRSSNTDDEQRLLTTSTGLGLAISKQIILRFKGEIHVQSALGKGAVFTIKLPIN